MSTTWSANLDVADAPSDLYHSDRALSTPRVLSAVVMISLAIGLLGLALVGHLGWNRFGAPPSLLIYLTLLCLVATIAALRWEAAQRDPTPYLVVAMLATAVYLEVAYGDFDDWAWILPSRDGVSTWLREFHRPLSFVLVLSALYLVVHRRRRSAIRRVQPPYGSDDRAPA